MILLTKLNGTGFYLNSDLIERIEMESDTLITLNDGKTIRVIESGDQIVDRIVAYKKKIYNKEIGVK
ncbi:MAG TPA: endoflagellar protein [Firmicutes bacterium]|nr:endoflagellar protein [Bacillota bacterium]